MSIKIPIETSARHLHISQEDFEKLFGEGSKPHFIKELSQPGQYLCQERVTERYFRKHGTSRSFPQRHAGRNVPYRHQKTGDSKRDTPVR